MDINKIKRVDDMHIYGGYHFVRGEHIKQFESFMGDSNVVIGTRTWLGPEWTHVDVQKSPLTGFDGSRHPVDVVCDARKLKLPSDSADLVYSQECLEHFPKADYYRVLMEWCRVVKPGGVIIVEVPDFLACCQQVLTVDTLEMDRAIQQLFYGGQVNEWDFHYNGFTPRIFADDFSKLGFDEVSIKRGAEVGYLQAIGRKR